MWICVFGVCITYLDWSRQARPLVMVILWLKGKHLFTWSSALNGVISIKETLVRLNSFPNSILYSVEVWWILWVLMCRHQPFIYVYIDNSCDKRKELYFLQYKPSWFCRNMERFICVENLSCTCCIIPYSRINRKRGFAHCILGACPNDMFFIFVWFSWNLATTCSLLKQCITLLLIHLCLTILLILAWTNLALWLFILDVIFQQIYSN